MLCEAIVQTCANVRAFIKGASMQENEIVVLSDGEVAEVSGAGSFANAVGFAVGYIMQKSATYYGNLGADYIV